MDRQQTSAAHPGVATSSELTEQHYEIMEGATGYTYERIFRPYIDTATRIQVEDPYVRLPTPVKVPKHVEFIGKTEKTCSEMSPERH